MIVLNKLFTYKESIRQYCFTTCVLFIFKKVALNYVSVILWFNPFHTIHFSVTISNFRLIQAHCLVWLLIPRRNWPCCKGSLLHKLFFVLNELILAYAMLLIILALRNESSSIVKLCIISFNVLIIALRGLKAFYFNTSVLHNIFIFLLDSSIFI